MVYIHSWQEFQDAAEALYSKSPNNVCLYQFQTIDFLTWFQSSILQTRYCVKFRSSEGKLVLKITDNTTVSLIFQYYHFFLLTLNNSSVSSSKLILPSFSIDSNHWICRWCRRCKIIHGKRAYHHHHIPLRFPRYFHRLKIIVLALYLPKHRVWFQLQCLQLEVSKRKSPRRKNDSSHLSSLDYRRWKGEGMITEKLLSTSTRVRYMSYFWTLFADFLPRIYIRSLCCVRQTMPNLSFFIFFRLLEDALRPKWKLNLFLNLSHLAVVLGTYLLISTSYPTSHSASHPHRGRGGTLVRKCFNSPLYLLQKSELSIFFFF